MTCLAECLHKVCISNRVRSCCRYNYWCGFWLHHGAGREQQLRCSVRRGTVPFPRTIWESSFLFSIFACYFQFSCSNTRNSFAAHSPAAFPNRKQYAWLAGVGCLTEGINKKLWWHSLLEWFIHCVQWGGVISYQLLLQGAQGKTVRRHYSVLAPGEW